MKRRAFLGSMTGAALGGALPAVASIPKMKITRVRAYRPPRANPTFNQANLIVTVDTDAGITGIGEGGSKDMLDQCAGMLIGEDPTSIDRLWQFQFRGFFYPPGREKLHAQGALDLALWDIKGKALGVPVYQLLGGLARTHVECYTAALRGGSLREASQAAIAAGYRAFRTAAAEYPSVNGRLSEVGGGRAPAGTDRAWVADSAFRTGRIVDVTHQNCKEIREGVGRDGDWCIDFHTRLDMADSIRLCGLLEDLEPYFVEDPLRSEDLDAYAELRKRTNVPLAVGEQFGSRWEFHKLVEEQLIDYVRVTLPNVGGITEWMKIAAICETHMVGLIPHSTGPIATAALVHALAVFPGPVMQEGGGGGAQPHLPVSVDFRDGKLWPNQRPGLGVQFVPENAELILDVSKAAKPIPIFTRPDGSLTNW
jgi:L-alanine-DL-glutamate epimerase-like enolase superfamily enzyme